MYILVAYGALIGILILLSWILLKAYKTAHALSVLIALIGITIIAICLGMDLVARFIPDSMTASLLFRIYAVLSIISLPLFMAYIELSRSLILRFRYYIFFGLAMFLAGLRALSKFEISWKRYWVRSSFKLLIYGIDVISLLLIVLVIWLGIELGILAQMQLRRSSGKQTRHVLKIELLVTAICVIWLGFTAIAILLNMVASEYQPMMINFPLFLLAIFFTYAIYKCPFLPYLITQRVFGVYVFTRDGVPISEHIIYGPLREYFSLLSGFFSAVISAFSELGHTGEVRSINLAKMHVIFGVGKNVITAIFVDTPIALHKSIADRIASDLDKLEIPPIITSEIQKMITEKIQAHLAPLFP